MDVVNLLVSLAKGAVGGNAGGVGCGIALAVIAAIKNAMSQKA
jgi:hypothetical protein